MATTYTSVLQPSNSTDALFRAWATFVRDAFLAGAWIHTADTGQINLATVTRPTVANEKRGFIIMRMDDSLQASFPVFVRVDFGSGTAANSPAVWVTIGTGTDGAGVISGSIFANGATTQIRSSSSSTTQAGVTCHSSASAAHCAVVMFTVQSSVSFIHFFSIERGRDSAGVQIGTHVFLQYNGAGSGNVDQLHYLVRAGGTQLGQGSAPVIVAPTRPAHHQQDVGFGVIVPFATVSGFNIPQPACLGFIATEGDSWTTDAQITVYMYQVPVVYRRVGVARFASSSGGVAVGSHVVWQRYD